MDGLTAFCVVGLVLYLLITRDRADTATDAQEPTTGEGNGAWVAEWSRTSIPLPNTPPDAVLDALWRTRAWYLDHAADVAAWTSAYRSAAVTAAVYVAQGGVPPAHSAHELGTALDLVPRDGVEWWTLQARLADEMRAGRLTTVLDETGGEHPHYHVEVP